mmetsp:Transcript_9508/g.27192  ORF Transcript_9508/g.27192 Transcript_9508/m.27192 type:complete len:809 (-) Transcript_9508:3728-6154(-)
MDQKPNKKLQAKIIYDEDIAKSFHNTDYYESQHDHKKNVVEIDEAKRKLSTSNWELVNSIIDTQIEAAKNEKYRIFKILYNIRIKVVTHIEEGMELPTHKDLLNIIANRHILLAAYRTTRKNKGIMTVAHPLSKEDFNKLDKASQDFIEKSYGLPDGLTWEIIDEISTLIKNDKYPWGTSRRIWIPKPGTTKERPITTIPPYTDKMVQEAIRMVLESIYEPVFQCMNCSFGFRASTGVHNAIYEIKNNTCPMSTAIEGDIENAYPSLDHNIMIKILSERIKDKKFLRFLKNRLKMTLFDTKTERYKTNFLGIPQGGIDSPYLWNIYLMGMDEFIQNDIQKILDNINSSRLKSQRNGKPLKTQPMNPEYNRVKKLRDRERKELDNCVKGDLEKDKYFDTLKNKRILTHQLRQISYYDPNRKKISMLYLRYADDFIILTNAPKDINKEIKDKLTIWLLDNRKLTLSDEKTKLTDITKNPAHFLGFEITNFPTRRVSTVKGYLKRTTGWQKKLGPDRERLINRLHMKGYCQKDGFPREIPILTRLDSYSLIEKTNSIMMGFANYYVNYISYNTSLNRWLYIIRWSCIKTLCQKYNTNIKGVMKKHPNLVSKITIQHKEKIFTKSIKLMSVSEAINKSKSNTDFYRVARKQNQIRSGTFVYYRTAEDKVSQINKSQRTPRIMDDNYFKEMNWVVSRTVANFDLPCLLCGWHKTEMHHVKHVRKSNWSSISPNNFIKQLQYIRNRKQIPLCTKCHREVHNGNYDQSKLSSLIKTKIADNRISAIEGYIISSEPYQGLPLEEHLLERGWTLDKK